MCKPLTYLAAGIAAVFFVMASDSASAADSYADDRAAIENLMARYLFALDFRDAEAYAATFTEDGVLNHGGGLEKGRAAIRNMVAGLRDKEKQRAAEDKSGVRPIPGRHSITNIIIEVNGDRATARAYWTHFGANEQRRAIPTSFGHYEDTLVKLNGQWLFAKRIIFNEFRTGREWGVLNPD